MKFITISGIDKSGKSTLIDRLWKETGKKHYIMDRDLSSFHYFNHLFGRISGDKNYHHEYKYKIDSFRKIIDLAIILTVEEEDWKERCFISNEPELQGGLSFKEHQDGIVNFFNKARYKNVLRLNTSVLSEEECLDKIYKRLGFHNKRKDNANK